ncbi:hypothetical protein [Actinomadura roseirufa]|uniref:hypothetical protein n=1 Tax=Actinomadura roseirufa TaxID=2094049 RepID=UPI0010414AF7|nr:hypothetical protein [Actinomadura roseirufa]
MREGAERPAEARSHGRPPLGAGSAPDPEVDTVDASEPDRREAAGALASAGRLVQAGQHEAHIAQRLLTHYMTLALDLGLRLDRLTTERDRLPRGGVEEGDPDDPGRSRLAVIQRDISRVERLRRCVERELAEVREQKRTAERLAARATARLAALEQDAWPIEIGDGLDERERALRDLGHARHRHRHRLDGLERSLARARSETRGPSPGSEPPGAFADIGALAHSGAVLPFAALPFLYADGFGPARLTGPLLSSPGGAMRRRLTWPPDPPARPPEKATDGDAGTWLVILGVMVAAVLLVVIISVVSDVPAVPEYRSGVRPSTRSHRAKVPPHTAIDAFEWTLTGGARISTTFDARRNVDQLLRGRLDLAPGSCAGAPVAWSIRGNGKVISSGELGGSHRVQRLNRKRPLVRKTMLDVTASRSDDRPCGLVLRWLDPALELPPHPNP